MTFNYAPWAIDGARTPAALARIASYAGSGGKSGIIQPPDLRVLPLEVPGVGLRVLSGGATILNHYLTQTDQAYIVSNPSTHVVQAASMPAASPSLRHFLLCVVVGDPEFDQTGHPFMPGTPIPEELQADYEYVRTVMVPCPANATRFEQLGMHYPAYALARIEIPANTTTITSAMITDVRSLAQARSERKVLLNAAPSNEALITEPWAIQDWISWKPLVEVPIWATRVDITVTLSGIVTMNPGAIGQLRAVAGPLVGSIVNYDIDVPTAEDGERRTQLLAVGGDITSAAGGFIELKVQGSREQGVGYLTTLTGAQMVFDLQFSESPV